MCCGQDAATCQLKVTVEDAPAAFVAVTRARYDTAPSEDPALVIIPVSTPSELTRTPGGRPVAVQVSCSPTSAASESSGTDTRACGRLARSPGSISPIAV